MISWPLVQNILTAAFRDRLVIAMVAMFVVSVAIALFFGSSVVIEQDQFSIVFLSWTIRLVTVFALVFFIIFFTRRSFETHDIDFILSRPIGRLSFILSHSFAFFFLVLLFTFMTGITLLLIPVNTIPSDGYILWLTSIFIEYLIVSHMAFFLGMVLPSSSICAMAFMGFYILTRLIGEILGIIQQGVDTPVMFIASKIMEIISIFIPRLDLMGQTSWLLYGAEESSISFTVIFLQGFFFIGLLIIATFIDLRKRQF